MQDIPEAIRRLAELEMRLKLLRAQKQIELLADPRRKT